MIVINVWILHLLNTQMTIIRLGQSTSDPTDRLLNRIYVEQIRSRSPETLFNASKGNNSSYRTP